MKYIAKCPACEFSDQHEFDTCPNCGLIIEKYFARQLEQKQREIEKELEVAKQVEQEKIALEKKEVADKARRAAKAATKASPLKLVVMTIGGIIIGIPLYQIICGASIYMSVIIILYGGGCVLALGTLILASTKQARSARIILGISALFTLLLQGGCWMLITSLDIAASGHTYSYSRVFQEVMEYSVLIFVIWVVIVIAKGKQSSETNRENN